MFTVSNTVCDQLGAFSLIPKHHSEDRHEVPSQIHTVLPGIRDEITLKSFELGSHYRQLFFIALHAMEALDWLDRGAAVFALKRVELGDSYLTGCATSVTRYHEELLSLDESALNSSGRKFLGYIKDCVGYLERGCKSFLNDGTIADENNIKSLVNYAFLKLKLASTSNHVTNEPTFHVNGNEHPDKSNGKN